MYPKIDFTDVMMETERILLRPWKESDLEDFYEYASIPGLGEMAGWKRHKSRKDTKKILRWFMEEKNVLAIVYKENNKVIGSMALEPYREDVAGEEFKDLVGSQVGYVLHKDYWGKEIAPEALDMMQIYCFEELNFDFLFAGTYLFNSQAQAVLEKTGFHFYDRVWLKAVDGEKEKGIYYLLRKEEWEGKLE